MTTTREFKPELPPEKMITVGNGQECVPQFLITSHEKRDNKDVLILPTATRRKWNDHPVHGPTWRERLSEFDKSMCEPSACETVVEDVNMNKQQDHGDQSDTWHGEPKTRADLEEAYTVVHNLNSRDPSYSLLVVDAQPKESHKKDGMETTSTQKHKLFMTAQSDTMVTCDQFIIAHGPAGFVKREKGIKYMEDGSLTLFSCCVFTIAKHFPLSKCVSNFCNPHICLGMTTPQVTPAR